MTKDPKLKSPDPAFGTESAEQPSGEPEHEYDRLGEQQQAQEEESQEEIDWDAIDWEEIEKEIEKHPSEYPELCPEALERVQKEATLQRMLRFSSEGNWERFKTEFEGLPLEEKEKFNKEVNRAATREFHRLAREQVLESTGQDEKRGGAFRTGVLYKRLNPKDGVESVLARMIVALTDTTMECVRRASVSDALPARDLELGYAMKGALIMSALIKAWDYHREPIRHPKKTG